MDIKLKNFSLNRITKGVLFLLIVATITTAMVQFQIILLKGTNLECLTEEEYHKSKTFSTDILNALQQVTSVAYYYKELEDVSFDYFISGGAKSYSNTEHSDKEFYQKNDRAFFCLEDGLWKNGKNSQSIKFYNMLTPNYVVYIAFPDEYLDAKQQEWKQNKEDLLINIIPLISASVIGLLLLLALSIIVGRRPKDSQIHLLNIDKSYTETLLLFLGLGLWLYVKVIAQLLGEHLSIGLKLDLLSIDFFRMFTTENLSMTIPIAAITAIAGVIFLSLFLSIIKKLKAGIFLKDSLICKLLNRLYHIGEDIFKYLCYSKLFENASFIVNLRYRQQIFIASTIITTSFIVLLARYRQWWFLFFLFTEILLIMWYTIGNRRLYENINKEIAESLEEQMKAERMKVALVTNVSHDLKTPLTSIISFIDLLSKEKDLSETSLDYVRILQEKSERLKNIVIDLFDLAKSTSGDITLLYDYINLKKLMIQTLADMDDRIEASELQFKTKLPPDPVYVYSDGKKLYRVFQNLIDNALKYTMRDTRVYIDMEQKGQKVITTIKNVAGYDMNFTPKEILQRFSRGDQSRSTEGSGLGLSIAESFTEVCGGEMQVLIDGDLFKVIISFDITINDVVLS